MAQLGRPGLSPKEKAELRRRWKQGESLSDIARALKKGGGSVFGVLRLRGGIAPPAPRRSAVALSREEREEVSRSVAAGFSIRSIAEGIKRAPSTVSREISRNGGVRHYRAAEADEKAWDRSRRPKKCLCQRTPSCAGSLPANWSCNGLRNR
jgi:DNA-binding CsgD family transcriptional regulator